MFSRWRRHDIVFLCSATVDEVWIRSTARACRAQGLTAVLAVCDDGGPSRDALIATYAALGIEVRFGISYADAARIRCRVAVTASSDLDRRIFPTRAHTFVHMPHSLASLHMVYPEGAFDGYDLLFAAGPHHEAEYAAIAVSRRLGGTCRAVGYGKLDLLREVPCQEAPDQVLIAPSWGPDNLLDRCGVPLVQQLLGVGHSVIVRPHPLFMLERAKVVDEIRALDGVTVESSLDGDGAIRTAAVMVGDYSGTSFEFAALRRRPVVSVDVGRKVANPNWQSLGLDPIEVSARTSIGPIVAPDIDAIVAAVDESMRGQVGAAAIDTFIFDPPETCGMKAATLIKELV